GDGARGDRDHSALLRALRHDRDVPPHRGARPRSPEHAPRRIRDPLPRVLPLDPPDHRVPPAGGLEPPLHREHPGRLPPAPSTDGRRGPARRADPLRRGPGTAVPEDPRPAARRAAVRARPAHTHGLRAGQPAPGRCNVSHTARAPFGLGNPLANGYIVLSLQAPARTWWS